VYPGGSREFAIGIAVRLLQDLFEVLYIHVVLFEIIIITAASTKHTDISFILNIKL